MEKSPPRTEVASPPDVRRLTDRRRCAAGRGRVPADDLPGRLEEHLRANSSLLPAGSRILVAFSGGPDSTALLLLLNHLAAGFGWTLVAAHFDHGIRPGGPARAARLREWVASREITLVSGRPRRELEPRHADLRRARYRWLLEVAREEAADRIATGHQRDDQAETILFRILRGTGNHGLAGIPTRRGPIVRPLLGYERDELARWLCTQDAEPLDDPSNRDVRYARSRMRHAVLPALDSALGSGVSDTLLAIGTAAGEVRQAMRPVARRVLAAFVDGGAGQWPPPLRAEAIRLAARREGVWLRGAAVERAAREMLALKSGHGLDLGGGLRLERDFDAFRVRMVSAADAPDQAMEITDSGPGVGQVVLGGRRRRMRWGDIGLRDRGGTRVAVHVHADHYPLVVRSRTAGDRIRLPGGGKKLGRLMSEARVPAGTRDSVPVLVDRTGRVLGLLVPELAHRVDRDAAKNNANFMIEVEDG